MGRHRVAVIDALSATSLLRFQRIAIIRNGPDVLRESSPYLDAHKPAFHTFTQKSEGFFLLEYPYGVAEGSIAVRACSDSEIAPSLFVSWVPIILDPAGQIAQIRQILGAA